MTSAPMAQNPVAQDPTANCIFCKIVSGEIPSRKVYEDDKIVAVLDVFPATPGHIIIIPKQHYMILPQLPPELATHCSVIAKQLAGKVLSGLGANGVEVFVANGAVAGQKAPHFLVHIIPRYANDGITFTLPESQLPDAELEQIHAKIVPIIQKMNLGSPTVAQPSAQPQVAPTQAPVQPVAQPTVPPTAQPAVPSQPTTQPQPAAQPQQPMAQPAQSFPGQKSEEQIMAVLQQNPNLKQLLLEQPEVVKKLVVNNEKIGELFVGHSIDSLHQKLTSGTLGGAPQQAAPQANQQSQSQVPTVQPAQPVQQQPVSPQPVSQQPVQPQPVQQQPVQPQQGAQPAQNISEEKLLEILQSQPDLKQAIMDNPAQLQQAIGVNPQLEQIFKGHDVFKIAEKLKGQSSQLDKIAAMFDGDSQEKPPQQPQGGADLDKISKMFDA